MSKAAMRVVDCHATGVCVQSGLRAEPPAQQAPCKHCHGDGLDGEDGDGIVSGVTWPCEVCSGTGKALAERPAPVQRKATTYAERFTHVVSVLCGAQPPADMVAEWLANTEVNGEHRLQSWVLCQAATPFWAQGIVVLDAAHVLANEPEEGEGHEDATQPARPQQPFCEDEGCPHHGTKHICVTSAPQPALRKTEQADTARLDWLNNNFYNRENLDWDGNLSRDSLMWVFFAPTGVQGDIRRVIDAARGGQDANDD